MGAHAPVVSHGDDHVDVVAGRRRERQVEALEVGLIVHACAARELHILRAVHPGGRISRSGRPWLSSKIAEPGAATSGAPGATCRA